MSIPDFQPFTRRCLRQLDASQNLILESRTTDADLSMADMIIRRIGFDRKIFPILRGIDSIASKDVLEFMYSMTKTMHSMLEKLKENRIRKRIYVNALNSILQ